MKIKGLFDVFRRKKVNTDIFNIHHPEFMDAVEPAFKVGKTQYYRFKQEVQMPWSRYMIMQSLLTAQDLRMDHDLLAGYIQLMKKAINGSKGVINLSDVIKILTQMESRMVQAFEVDTTYALASVVYFDETEDMYSYNKAYNQKKVATWKEARVVDFFYTRPMGELLGLKNTSPEDLVKYIDQQTDLIRELTTEMHVS